MTPPDYVEANPLALIAWRTICARLYVLDDDASPDVIGSLAMMAALHCWGRIVEAERAAFRIECRKLMALLGLLPDARVPLAELRPDGLDADIARLCGCDAAPP